MLLSLAQQCTFCHWTYGKYTKHLRSSVDSQKAWRAVRSGKGTWSPVLSRNCPHRPPGVILDLKSVVTEVCFCDLRLLILSDFLQVLSWWVDTSPRPFPRLPPAFAHSGGTPRQRDRKWPFSRLCLVSASREHELVILNHLRQIFKSILSD